MHRYLSLIVASLLIVCGCEGRPASNTETAPQPQFRVDATIKDIMDAMVDPSADYIWDAVSQ